MLVADAYPNFSICGLPYYLSGDVTDWPDLAHCITIDLDRRRRQARGSAARTGGTVARHARALVRHGRASPPRSTNWKPKSPSWSSTLRGRCWRSAGAAADRGEDPRRDRRRRPIPLQARLRPPHRYSPTAGLVIQPGAPPFVPHRQQATQRSAAPHRHDPGLLAPRGSRHDHRRARCQLQQDAANGCRQRTWVARPAVGGAAQQRDL